MAIPLDRMIRLFNTTPTDEEVEIVARVMRSGNLVMGPEIEALGKELFMYLGVEGGVVPCASGTDALVLALEQLDCLGWGVVVPAMTFSATYEAVVRAGCVPVLCDVDEATGTPTLAQVRDAVVRSVADGTGVAAVVLVHLYGWPAFFTEEIADFCHSMNLRLIEDCAQAFGATLNGHQVGTFGDAAAFSFYPTKPLGGIGDGGGARFSSVSRANRAASARNHGRTQHGQEFAGYNSRMDEVNAAVLRHRLANYQSNIDHRRAAAARYAAHGLKKKSMAFRGNGVPYVYPIFCDGALGERESIRFRLADAGIESRVHYDPSVADLPYVGENCPGAKYLANRVLSLPCHHGMTEGDVDKVSDALRRTTGEAEVNGSGFTGEEALSSSAEAD